MLTKANKGIEDSSEIKFNYDFFNDLVHHSRIVNNFFSGNFDLYKEVLISSNQWTLPLNLATHYFIKDYGDFEPSYYCGCYDSNTKLKSDVKKFIKLQLNSHTKIFDPKSLSISITLEDVKESMDLLKINSVLQDEISKKKLDSLLINTAEHFEHFNNFFTSQEVRTEFFSEEGWYLIYKNFLDLVAKINHEFLTITCDSTSVFYNKAIFVSMLISKKFLSIKLTEFFAKDATNIFLFIEDLRYLINSECEAITEDGQIIEIEKKIKLVVSSSDRVKIKNIIDYLSEIITQ